jgi:hypothetical protein
MMEWTSKQTVEEWVKDCEELDGKLENEEQLWRTQGFHLGMIDINAYLVQLKINTLLTFLQDELGISDAELNARFKMEQLKQFKHDRAMLIEHKLKSKRPDMAVIERKLLGPDGRAIL